MARKIIYILIGLAVVVLLAAVFLPFVIDANRFRPRIESLMSASLNRKVEIGNVRLSIFSGGVAVSDLSIADDPKFNRDPFLKASSVTASVELGPLIFSRQLHITGLTIDQPEVTLLRSPSGTWNFSTLGATASQPKPADPPPSGADLSIARLNINGGKVLVGNVGAAARHTYDQVNLTASDLSYVTQFPFRLQARAPGNGTITLAGKAGPLNQRDAQQTSVSATLTVRGLDLRSTGFIDPSSGIAGLLDFTGVLESDGRRMDSHGKVTASKLQLVQGGSPARQPVDVDYDVDYQLQQQAGVLKHGDLHVGKALASLTGTYRTVGETTSVQMKLNGENMPVSDLEGLLPALGVILPPGSSLKQGTAGANLTISGPVDHLVTTGPVHIANTRLSGFSLGSKMSALATFAGLPKGADTEIQSLTSQLRIAPEGIRADDFQLVVPTIGSLTGSGVIGADHSLNFRMVAHVTSSASPLSAIAGLVSGGSAQNRGGNIPFRIQGTTSNPVFVPDVGAMFGNAAKKSLSSPSTGTQQKQGLGGLLNQILQNKKKQ
jgi:AsmA protein